MVHLEIWPIHYGKWRNNWFPRRHWWTINCKWLLRCSLCLCSGKAVFEIWRRRNGQDPRQALQQELRLVSRPPAVRLSSTSCPISWGPISFGHCKRVEWNPKPDPAVHPEAGKKCQREWKVYYPDHLVVFLDIAALHQQNSSTTRPARYKLMLIKAGKSPQPIPWTIEVPGKGRRWAPGLWLESE